MQPTPLRLSRAIWSAFKAARPAHQPSRQYHIHCTRNRPDRQLFRPLPLFKNLEAQKRFYSDHKLPPDVEKKVEDAKDRIEESLENRADAAANAQSPVKQPHDETIIHTLPESSSIVHTRDAGPRNKPDDENNPSTQKHESEGDRADLPSQLASFRSNLSHRFSHFMDNLQSHVFVASRRLNDLTGYTGIERLKADIETQEDMVQKARKAVKDTRASYSEAIATRSATQREVNDLLHRKHAWSPQDLERFTSLYRSDHANEQAEQRAHQALSEAEVRYEEASTKLAKSILARYHEEQIWSDKIRQMSTWGTWGLMGLNVLLFVVLQLAIEPWRRRRLVRGFEEKVEAALTAREAEDAALAVKLDSRVGNEIIQEAVDTQPEGIVAAAGEQVAEAIVDAITGATDEADTQASMQAGKQDASDTGTAEAITKIVESVPEGGTPDVLPDPDLEIDPLGSTIPWTWTNLSASFLKTMTNTYHYCANSIAAQFDETEEVAISRLDLTIMTLESILAGAVFTAGAAILLAGSGPR